jgi:hypothetical protein
MQFRTKNKDFVAAALQGGLGNQLFIIAAAWEQADRLNCDLVIDTSFYANQDLRVPEVQKLGTPFAAKFVDAGEKQGISKFLSKLVLRRRIARSKNNYVESSFAYSSEIHSIAPGTKIHGYFQSEKYFEHISQKLFASIMSSQTTDADDAVLAKYPDGSFVAIHVRRGDYVSNPDATLVHGLTSEGYFREALAHLNKGDRLPVLVFTDSPDAVRHELRNIPGLFFDEELMSMSDLGTLKLFSKSASIAISNSTFSWWGAWLMQQRNPGAKVVYPTPWFSANIDYGDLLPQNWNAVSK